VRGLFGNDFVMCTKIISLDQKGLPQKAKKKAFLDVSMNISYVTHNFTIP
jgi:hypothetical protein